MNAKRAAFQLISALDIVAFAFICWLVLISFYEADFWHFTDPSTSGLSITGSIVLFVAFCITPFFLCWKKLRLLKLHVVLLFLLKILPGLLLLISSLPQLNSSPWGRTGLLAFGVALLPFVVSWILSRSNDDLPAASDAAKNHEPSANFKNVIEPESLEKNDSTPTISSESRDSFIDVIILAAIQINITIRYSTASINVFYEDWRYSCALFVFGFLLAALKSALLHVYKIPRKDQCLPKPNSPSPLTQKNNAMFDNRSNMTAQTNLSDNGSPSIKHEATTYTDSENTLNKSECSSESPQKVLSWPSALIVGVSGGIHGVNIGSLVVLFVWLFSSPHILCRWSGLDPYYNGVFVVLGLLFGLFATLLFRPERLCFAPYESKRNLLSEKQISMRIYVKLGCISLLLTALLSTALALLLLAPPAGSFIGSILFCLILPYCFSVTVQSATWIVTIVSNNTKSTFMRLFPGLIAFLAALFFVVFHLFFIFFINPQLTSAFLGNMGLIIGLVIGITILSFVSFILTVKTLFNRFDNNNVHPQSLCNCKFAPSSWLGKLQQKLPSNLTSLMKYGFICLIITIITLLVGPLFNHVHCVTCNDETIGTVSNYDPYRMEMSSLSNFSVFSWNLLFGHDKLGRDNLPCIAEVLKVLQPDVTAVQESDSLPPYWGGKDILGYLAGSLGISAYVGVEPLKSSLGVGFLTSFEVVNHQRYVLEEDEDRTLPHYSLLQIDCIINNEIVAIFNLHAVFKNWTATEENPSPYANLSAAQMLFIAEKANQTSLTRPTIVMGDFNLNPMESELDIFFDMGFENALITDRNVLPPATINNRFAVIDHIFFKGLELLASAVINTTATISDHFPIMARFQLPS